MQLTLIVPGLLALPAAMLAASEPLARFARYATMTESAGGIAAAALTALGLPSAPAAPLLALGAGLDPGADAVLAADPVALVAGRDDVRLAARIADLDATAAGAFIERLNDHFRDDGLVFAAPRPDAWFVRMAGRPALATTATDAVLGRPILPYLPTGDDARNWQRWNSEIQMLLHAAPQNEIRERDGRPPVNGVWFWGAGMKADVGSAAEIRAFATSGTAGDLVRGLARHAGGDASALPRRFETELADGAPPTILLSTPASDADLHAIAQDWIAPAIAALEQGRITALALVANGRGTATWTARRPSFFARLAARFGNATFVPPSGE